MIETYVCDADLKDGEKRGLKIDNQWLLVVKYKEKYFLLDNACAHSGYPLHEGPLDANGVITCRLHNAKFDCQTGQLLSSPAICDAQPVFNVQEKDGKVFWLRD